MEFYKYYVTNKKYGNTIAGIKSNTYAKSYDYIQQLVFIAKQDFPYLKDEDIEVIVYGGDRWKRQMGIEFTVSSILSDYKKHRELEYTLS